MGPIRSAIILAALSLPSACFAAGDLDGAPPAFPFRDGMAVFLDLDSVDSQVILRPAEQKASFHSVLKFRTESEGFPLLNLPNYGTVLSLSLDGKALDPAEFRIANPDPSVNWSARALPVSLKPGAYNLKLDYELPFEDEKTLYRHDDGSAYLFTLMDDFSGVGPKRNQAYLETLFPTNLQFDQYSFKLSIQIDSAIPHTVMTNGSLRSPAPNHFELSFPAHFTTNSFFIHVLAAADLGPENHFVGTYQSIDGRSIPVEVYCEKDNASYCGEAFNELKKDLGKIEQNVAPYPYERFLHRDTMKTHSMEYAGAFTGSFDAIHHEAAHSWFGRCVKPVSGQDGWFDEAAASWIEDDFPRAAKADLSDLTSTPNDLTNTRGYGVLTAMGSYEGARLFRKLDKLFENQGGFRPLLSGFFEKTKFQTITTAQFHDFLLAQPIWNKAAEHLFQVLIYGNMN